MVRVKAMSGSLENAMLWWDEKHVQQSFTFDKPESFKCPICGNVIGESVYGSNYEPWYIAIKINCPKCGIALVIEEGEKKDKDGEKPEVEQG